MVNTERRERRQNDKGGDNSRITQCGGLSLLMSGCRRIRGRGGGNDCSKFELQLHRINAKEQEMSQNNQRTKREKRRGVGG